MTPIAATKSKSPKTVTINIPIPVDLHHRLRVQAVTNGSTMKDAVISAITDWTKTKR